MSKTMAEALARRNFEAEYDDLLWEEMTDKVKRGWVTDAQAIIDFLSAAGFGLVTDAKAEAWDHGHHDGAVDQILHLENDGAKTMPNPYRDPS